MQVMGQAISDEEALEMLKAADLVPYRFSLTKSNSDLTGGLRFVG